MDLTISARIITSRTFYLQEYSLLLNFIFTQEVILPFPSIVRRRSCFETKLSIFLCLLEIALKDMFFDSMPRPALERVRLFFSALKFFYSSCKHANVAPNVLSMISFFGMSCLKSWRNILLFFRSMMSFSLFFSSSLRRAIEEERTEEGMDICCNC